MLRVFILHGLRVGSVFAVMQSSIGEICVCCVLFYMSIDTVCQGKGTPVSVDRLPYRPFYNRWSSQMVGLDNCIGPHTITQSIFHDMATRDPA